MEKHPSIKFTLHFSGPLWEYMEVKEKDCWEIVKKLVKRGQIELMGGGFYEPILPIIPAEDRLGQIEMMNKFLEEKFQIKPRGLWLAERVWEPHLPKTLAQSGIEYTFLDEEHFHYAGINNIYTTYITEDEGYPLNLFPIDKKLRYLIPFKKLEDIQSYFREIGEKEGTAILADDGEKFGLWPGTNKWVFEEGWLSNFLTFLEAEGIQTLTCSEYLDKFLPHGRVYLPPASYEEMMEWVLKPEEHEVFRKMKEGSPQDAKRFLRGGFFREFFLKYPESNHLHKRMFLVSSKVNRQKNEHAKKELYQGQCNDAYWHGVFGGLYLPHLRQAVWSHLLEAEKNLPFNPGWEKIDYDLDGEKELFYQGQKFNLLLEPSLGGGIVELDYKPLSRNLTDILSRRKESYHTPREEGGDGRSIHELARKIPQGTEDLLRYDWYPRFSLLDHFFHPQTTKEDVKKINYGEQGDFVNREYDFDLKENRLILTRRGHIWVESEKFPIQVKKEILPEANSISVSYEIENLAEKDIFLFFGSEWNLYLLPEEIEMSEKAIFFLKRKLSFELSPQFEIWHFPLRTLSQSEEGYDIIYQGICLVPFWKINLVSKQKFSMKMSLRDRNGS